MPAPMMMMDFSAMITGKPARRVRSEMGYD
jgi:hypothetical protein